MEQNIFLKELKKKSQARNIPNISEENAKFLVDLIKKNNYKKILEIGTANGYSSICLAYEIQKWWHITTIEFSSEAHEEAKSNFKEAWVDHIITPLLWNALLILPDLQETYDFIFIDGMKKHSLSFYLLSKDKLEKWGTIIIDDVIKFKHKMLSLYEYLDENNISYEVLQIDSDDGIMIIKK